MIGAGVSLVGIEILMNSSVAPGVIWCYQVHKLVEEGFGGFPFRYSIWSYNGLRNSRRLQMIPIKELTTLEMAEGIMSVQVASRIGKGYLDRVAFNWETGKPALDIPGLPIPTNLDRELGVTTRRDASTRSTPIRSRRIPNSEIASESSTHAFLT